MALTINRGIAEATYQQLLNANSDINGLSTEIGDHKRNNPRAMMLALVTNHPGMVANPTARVVYKSDAHMQPWKKAGVTTGNLRFDAGLYNKQFAIYSAMIDAIGTMIAGPAKTQAIKDAYERTLPQFNTDLDYTELMPNWNFNSLLAL